MKLHILLVTIILAILLCSCQNASTPTESNSKPNSPSETTDTQSTLPNSDGITITPDGFILPDGFPEIELPEVTFDNEDQGTFAPVTDPSAPPTTDPENITEPTETEDPYIPDYGYGDVLPEVPLD